MSEMKNQQINIELTEEIGEGVYSNLAIISHSNTEFILDFVRIMPGLPKAKVQSRIILAPEHAKGLLNALKENIAKYEALNGKIKNLDGEDSGPVFPINFGGPTPKA